MIVILNNIRSNENVGSIFRTCDAAGVSKIILCGYTPTPIDRFGRENKGLTKASLGAEKFVEWEKVESLKDAIEILNNSPLTPLLPQERGTKKTKFRIIGIEQSENSIDYKLLKTKIPLAQHSLSEVGDSESKHLALVFGNEVEGLSEDDLKLCDLVAEIPMRGRKESLNVSVAAGIVIFELADQS